MYGPNGIIVRRSLIVFLHARASGDAVARAVPVLIQRRSRRSLRSLPVPHQSPGTLPPTAP
ncbi:hypothetical protein VE22_21190 [Enterobacter hormaechei]|nr:hypothetical protein VE22_21190 [Enterobacter hormaechei]